MFTYRFHRFLIIILSHVLHALRVFISKSPLHVFLTWLLRFHRLENLFHLFISWSASWCTSILHCHFVFNLFCNVFIRRLIVTLSNASFWFWFWRCSRFLCSVRRFKSWIRRTFRFVFLSGIRLWHRLYPTFATSTIPLFPIERLKLLNAHVF